MGGKRGGSEKTRRQRRATPPTPPPHPSPPLPAQKRLAFHMPHGTRQRDAYNQRVDRVIPSRLREERNRARQIVGRNVNFVSRVVGLVRPARLRVGAGRQGGIVLVGFGVVLDRELAHRRDGKPISFQHAMSPICCLAKHAAARVDAGSRHRSRNERNGRQVERVGRRIRPRRGRLGQERRDFCDRAKRQRATAVDALLAAGALERAGPVACGDECVGDVGGVYVGVSSGPRRRL